MLPARLNKSKVPATYTWIAPTHDWLALIVERRARQLGLKKANIKDGERILEVAVGTGLSFQELVAANPSGKNTGIDITPAMLKKARRRMRKYPGDTYQLLHGDAYALPFENNTFDLLMNSYMFDMLPVADFVPVLSEFYRVLTPGGRLVMMNMTLAQTRVQKIWDGLYRLHPFLLGGCRGIALAPFLKEAGFREVERDFVSQWSFPSEVLQGLK